jgi:hypothetical protein
METKQLSKIVLFFSLVLMATASALLAQNPIIHNQFTADPTARVFGDSVYLYPSHDIPTPSGQNLKKDWFCMEDYHVFSSSNLTDWTDHGVIVSQTSVPWANPKAFSMWAPDCINKNGKYYFYFPAAPDSIYGRGFAIGVAVSDNPCGPFKPELTPIKKAQGIDPNVFVNKDGQAYLYWSGRGFMVAKLKDNMTELASEPHIINNLPEKGLKEGPFLFERNGIYYLTFPHVENKIERLEYAIGNNPMGPFKMAGVIMDESLSGCWTNHQSVINFRNQWYLFYHNNDLSPKFDKNRSVRIDSLFFNTDGTIRKVIPTFRGVGLTNASDKIQTDRYSRISEKGASVVFIDSLNAFGGWKTVFNSKDAWVQYNSVDFGKKELKTINFRVASKTGCTLQLRLNSINGQLIAKVNIPKEEKWQTVKVPVSGLISGIQNLVLSLSGGMTGEIDWISFE